MLRIKKKLYLNLGTSTPPACDHGFDHKGLLGVPGSSQVPSKHVPHASTVPSD